MHPVVIVGGGLAGLVCARELHRQGIPIQLFEAADRPGGRVRTDVVDGFRLDRGFQVYFDAYPNASQALDHQALDLMAFSRGALVFQGGALHEVDYGHKLQMAMSPFFGLKDKLQLLRWMGDVSARPARFANGGHDVTAAEYFTERGFSSDLIAKFMRPFYAGVFVDPELQTSSKMIEFISRAILKGRTVIPADGMEAIPRQIAARLPRHLLHMDARTASVERDSSGRADGIRLDTGEAFPASSVVVATGAPIANQLTGAGIPTAHSASICLYFETPEPLFEGAYLALNGDGKGIVNEFVPLTNVAPSYAPPGRHLACATILKQRSEPDAVLVDRVREEMDAWFPGRRAAESRLIRIYRIDYHQFLQPPGFSRSLPRNTTSTPGLFLAGEFTTHSSIDGAVESGQRCAEAIVRAGEQAP